MYGFLHVRVFVVFQRMHTWFEVFILCYCYLKVIKWNGLYNGKGGSFGGNDVPASDCDNFWMFIKEG